MAEIFSKSQQDYRITMDFHTFQGKKMLLRLIFWEKTPFDTSTKLKLKSASLKMCNYLWTTKNQETIFLIDSTPVS